MNVAQLEASGRVLFKTLTGSHAYGLNTPQSDMDYRGIFYRPMQEQLSLKQQPDEVGDDKQDVKFYSLRKFFELASDCNPNIIELLFMPPECVRVMTPAMERIIAARSLFVSRKAKHTFSGYAYAQIKKAKGQNKWVNNPQPETRPAKEDFCWFIPRGSFDAETPARPVPYREQLANDGWPLKMCHAVQMEHVPSMYRLYFFGSEAKGVFRDQQLVCESVSKEDEARFIGLLIYNEQAFDRALENWKGYWDWMRNRNTARWESQENGTVDYDVKNMMHCIRLLLSGLAILSTGAPVVRFEGENLELLRGIRLGKFKHEQLMEMAEKLMADMDVLYETSALPHSADRDGIDELYLRLCLELG